MLNVGGFLYDSLVNGEGIRNVVFFQGCLRNCTGCQNKSLQPIHSAQAHQMTVNDVLHELTKSKELIDGVTLSGGDPLYQNIEDLIALCFAIKQQGLTVWMYTGALFNEIPNLLLRAVDVVIDGPFIQDLYDENLKYRGSSNQRILYLEEGKIIKEEH